MKIFRALFSRLFFVILSFLLQIALIVVILIFANEYAFVYSFYLIFILLAIFLFFKIINSKMKSEYKIPWLVLVIPLPFFTLFLYWFYANPQIKRKDYKKMMKICDECYKYLPKEAISSRKNNGELDPYFGISTYLSKVAEHEGTFDNRVTFYPMGEDYWDAMIPEMEKAKRYIYLQFFIIKPGVMWDRIVNVLLKKAKEGLDVRVMYDDMGSSTTPIAFAKNLEKNGIKCQRFNKLSFFSTGKVNNRDHRKILVIDGKVGFTGGVNLGDEYINVEHPFGSSWKDTGLKIEGEAVKVLLFNFLLSFDSHKKRPLSDYKSIFNIKSSKFNEPGYVQPFVDGPKPFYEENIGENNYLNMIGSATKSLYITTPYLICDNALLTAVRNAAIRGVDVRLITPHVPDKKVVFAVTRSNYETLMEAGVKVYEYTPGFLHAKEMIVDSKVAFVGTINLDYRSLTHHFECGANLYGSKAVKDIEKDFFDTIKISEEVNLKKLYLNFFMRIVISIVNIFLPML